LVDHDDSGGGEHRGRGRRREDLGTQRGLWDTAVAELGQRAGIMKKHGLYREILYTSGGAESQQHRRGTK